MKTSFIVIFILSLISSGQTKMPVKDNNEDRILSYTIDPKKQNLQLYWKDDKGQIIKTIKNLKTYTEKKDQLLIFAMNAGMFTTDYSPLGLYIEHKKTLKHLNNVSSI